MSLAKILAAALAALACLSSACATRDDASAAKKTKGGDARELYARNCAVCHGPVGEGKQVGTLRVPTLREGRAAQDPDAQLLKQIHDGGNGMPPFKFTLTDDEIQVLLRFVREEFQGKQKAKAEARP
ncbi:MAG TPA: cytochrome c [Pyrinomonadaceae bacterium]|jgi:alcohol dehydrogenase (cytochrome c)/quinohemoprotein ethanol dehydrogenase|nr:cytochrome c [Pyrinomonadaceae bacterium]